MPRRALITVITPNTGLIVELPVQGLSSPHTSQGSVVARLDLVQSQVQARRRWERLEKR